MITIHPASATDCTGLGLCALTPLACAVEERAGGLYQLTMTHPIDETGRWRYLVVDSIIRAPTPVREAPVLRIGQTAGTTVTRSIYRVQVNSRLRLRNGPGTHYKILGRYKSGALVVKLSVQGDWIRVSVVNGGAVGWMHADYLAFVRDQTETVPSKDVPGDIVATQPARDQLFRINAANVDDASGVVHVTALHITYDQIGNLIKGPYSPEKVAASAAIAQFKARELQQSEFSYHSDVTAKISGEYGYRSIIEALMETDGVIAQTGARLVRDNYDTYILAPEDRDRGVTIRHGKNLLGAIMSVDAGGCVNRVIPVGRDADGNELYLSGTVYVDSPRIGAQPIVRAKKIAYDVKVGKNADRGEFATVTLARAELKRLAELEFSENAIDMPSVSLDVDFAQLEHHGRYGELDYAKLQQIHLYDTVRVVSPRSGIDAKLRCVGYVYNCLTGKYDAMTLGDPMALDVTVSGYDIASGTISGNKIIPGTVNGYALRDATIHYAKIHSATIEQLNANALTAVSAHINSLTADKIQADALYASFAHLISLAADNVEADQLSAAIMSVVSGYIQSLTADEIQADALYASFAHIINLAADSIRGGLIEADHLAAALAEVVSLHVGAGDFDFAQIENLLSNALILQQGQMDSVQIVNLAVTSANLLNATIGNLVIQGDDGKYYRVFVGSDGNVRTEEATLTDGEISAGQTSAGNQIVSSTANIGSLNATNIQASSAVIATILTDSLTAGKITAGEALIASATIPALYTTSIQAIGNSLDLSANESIKAMVGRVASIYRDENPPEGANENDIWIRPSTGAIYQLTQADGQPEFLLDEDGNLYYRYSDGETEYALYADENGDLYIDKDAAFALTIAADGSALCWVRVQDGELLGSFSALEQKTDGITASVTETLANLDEATATVVTLHSELTQRADSLELEISKKVDGAELKTYLRYQDGALELGQSGSRYTTQISDSGFVVLQDGHPMTTMVQNTLSAPIIRPGRMMEIGAHVVRIGSGGDLIFN